MNHINHIAEIYNNYEQAISNIPTPKATLTISGSMIQMNLSSSLYEPDFDLNQYHYYMMMSIMKTRLNMYSYKYQWDSNYISFESYARAFYTEVARRLLNLVNEIIPKKIRKFKHILNSSGVLFKDNIQTFISIDKYYFDVTREHKLSHENNIKHKANLISLLKLMEKRHDGKTKSN